MADAAKVLGLTHRPSFDVWAASRQNDAVPTKRKMHLLYLQTEVYSSANFFLSAQTVRQLKVQPIFLFHSTMSWHKKGRHERTP